MKYAPLLLLLATFNVFSNNISDSDFEKTHLSRTDVYKSIPEYRNMWVSVVDYKGFQIYKQEGIFDIDGVQYRDVAFNQVPTDFEGYSISDSPYALQAEGFLTNKIRLMAGMPPISNHDNKIVMLCKLENHNDGEYYEITFTQYENVRRVFPSNYGMGHLCASGQTLSSYWKQRLGDFYDNFGNRR